MPLQALGCLLFFLAFGKLPFSGESKLQVLNGNYQMPATRPVPIRALIQDLLSAEPDHRPDIQSVLQRVQALQQYVHSSNAMAEANGGEPRSGSFTSASPTSSGAEPVAPLPVRVGSATSRLPPTLNSVWEKPNTRPDNVAVTEHQSGAERSQLSRQNSSPLSGNPFSSMPTLPVPDACQSMSRQQSTPQLQSQSGWLQSQGGSSDSAAPHQNRGKAPRSPDWANFGSAQPSPPRGRRSPSPSPAENVTGGQCAGAILLGVPLFSCPFCSPFFLAVFWFLWECST